MLTRTDKCMCTIVGICSSYTIYSTIAHPNPFFVRTANNAGFKLDNWNVLSPYTVVNIQHNNIECLKLKGYNIQVKPLQVNMPLFEFENSTHTVADPDLIAACKECDVNSVITYKSIFGIQQTTTIRWADVVLR